MSATTPNGWRFSPGSAASPSPGAASQGAGRLADDQAAGLAEDAGAGLAVQRGEKVLDRDRTELLEIKVHGGQWRAIVRGEDLPVVIADDRDVVRDPLAGLEQGLRGAGGDLVVAAEDRVKLRPGGEQHPGRPPAPG